MKKSFLNIAALLTITSSFAQAGDSGNLLGGALIFIISLAFLALVFYLIRSVLLWYWKINDIVNNQNFQSQILESQHKLLKENNQLLQDQLNFLKTYFDKSKQQ